MSKLTLSQLLRNTGLIMALAPPCSANSWQSGKQQNTLLELHTSQGCSSCPICAHYLT